MKIKYFKKTGGFSLLEIMVVVAIVAIMAASVVIGFNSFSQTVRTRETAGVLSDTLKSLELEILRKDYLANTIHFAQDYLFIESKVENASLDLSYAGGCPSGIKFGINNPSPSPIYLAKKDKYGNKLDITTYQPGGPYYECIKGFDQAEELEWQYQLFTENEASDVIRFLQFNLRRDNVLDPVTIVDGTTYTMKIEAPYAKTTFYQSGIPTANPVTLTLEGPDGETETIILQE